jgi:Family of unknown function (DUF6625)
MSREIIILILYFGRWPEWINLFIETCKWNPEVCWLLYTDCGEPENKAENVGYVHLGFNDYKMLVRERLGIHFDPPDPYKLCDLRPCLGQIHNREIEGFRFFGYGDIDVVYGNIRRFYTDDLLARGDAISTHRERLSGHFAVLRNTKIVRRAYECIPGYRELLEQVRYMNMDEGSFTAVFRSSEMGFRSPVPIPERFDPCQCRSLFIERYGTILSPRGWHDGTMNYPQRWLWRNGSLTNERDGQREFLYLHFMRWQSARWMNDPPAQGEAAWLHLKRIVNVDWRAAASSGFCVSPRGFTALSAPKEA